MLSKKQSKLGANKEQIRQLATTDQQGGGQQTDGQQGVGQQSSWPQSGNQQGQQA